MIIQFARIEAHRMRRNPMFQALAGGVLIGESRDDGAWWRWEGGADWAHGIERRTVAELEDALVDAWTSQQRLGHVEASSGDEL